MTTVRLRAMSVDDVPAVVAVQEPGSVVGLAEIFPQETHPFPPDEIARRWCEEIAEDGIECLVVEVDDEVAGFAAIRGDELLHFGIAVERWGTGLAQTTHDGVLERMRVGGTQLAWLRVFTANRRARRFYERLGWSETGDLTHSAFPPHPELRRYEFTL